jgi:hypothetical protein
MAGFKAKSAEVSRFSMVPRNDVPRSVFKSQHTHKTTFDSGFLVPIYVDEILPGDSCRLDMTAFVRLATPIFPIMDNLYLDTFFFFVPNRLVWTNWKRFMGEQISPGASTAFIIPSMTSPTGGYAVNSVYDYFGLPTVGQIAGGDSFEHSPLPLRAYALIWNEWFRDQNLQEPVTVNVDDGPDTPAMYVLMRRNKRHDYFTSALPWPMRETSLTSNEGFRARGGAPVTGIGALGVVGTGAANVYEAGGGLVSYAEAKRIWSDNANDQTFMRLDAAGYPDVRVQINDMRLAFAAQRLMEKDARGGSRYTEIVRSHFGVVSPDARLQRPEYLGGGSTPIAVNPIVQSSASDITGSATPLGQLGGVGTGVASGHGFSQSFTEHGHIIGLACVRADLTYQQGYNKLWRRLTRFDYYWPSFAHLGEQAVYRREIYARGDGSGDDTIFGYQERWAEYRHKPNRITGLFRSTSAGTVDPWHLAQNFTSAPVLGNTFIQENPPLDRVLAVGSAANGQQLLFDGFFNVRMVRPIPTFSVPGLADHF